MTNQEFAASSQDPSLTGGQTLMDNGLLQHVPAEVLEVYEPGALLEIERRAQEADRLENLRSSPDPFVYPKRPNEIDLSYLGETRATAVLKFGTAPRHGEVIKLWATRPDAGRVGVSHHRQLLLQFKEETRLGADNTASRTQSVWLAMEPFHRKLDELEALETVDGGEKTKLIEDALAELHGLNERLPSEATITTLANIAAVIEAYSAYQHRKFEVVRARHPARSPLKALAIRAMRTGEKGLVKLNDKVVSNTANQAARARADGSSAYVRLADMVKIQERGMLSKQIDLLFAAKSRLSVHPESLSLEELNKRIVVEEYLAGKADTATAHLKRLDPELYEDLLSDPEIRPILLGLSSRIFAEFEHQSRLDRAAGLSFQITEANDIRLGGRRLKPTKNLRDPSSIADSFEGILKEEDNRALVERGIILAILSDRYHSFADTIQRLQTAEDDEMLETVKRERPDVVRCIREINLPEHMMMLELLLDQYKDQIPQILSESEIEKVTGVLDRFFGREK